ncbi:hypothetical protein LGH70_09030 [Hymenobacter sp. BT635]|uniref:Uncharacterized protein n=1 Tax=Hymenobacter nitidus TaxID=2880929 RepID=A0ABS8ACQ8_9BACT|nr:hypothetical protein [Hymenobacter nitidus]MCB2377722.1 hypothetical protein [Hymenobacter nitidus]
MRHSDLPERWKTKLQDYLTAKGSNRETLSASDFLAESIVHIEFEDDSKIEFRYAFAIKAPELKEIAVFTEHCGYHLFQLHDGMTIKTTQQ